MTGEKYILGIDTGGTHTDAVILNEASREIVCSGKAVTTKENLSIGIWKSIQTLDFDAFEDIVLISLSTTLATNAIVEDKGCKVGLIVMGKDPEENSPAFVSYRARGQVNIKGRITEDIDSEEIINIGKRLHKEVDAIAISCYASVRNPRLEKIAKKVLSRTTSLPIFCAHELTDTLGYHERTVTSVLNAGLVQIISEFIHSTHVALKKMNIHAPIMVVKGDGSLMHENVALKKPIDTILSGPAASTIGAGKLSGMKDAIVLDIGGTTSDFINIDEGKVKICKTGAVVGGWHTRVKAANICTYGLGGDSMISFDKEKEIFIGPEKAEPLCITAIAHSELIDELAEVLATSRMILPVFYRKGKKPKKQTLTDTEKKILKSIKTGVYTAETLALKINTEVDLIRDQLENLVKTFHLIKCALTPTDILHAQGSYLEFEGAASKLGIAAAAQYCSMKPEAFIQASTKEISKKLLFCCLQSIAIFQGKGFDLRKDPSSLFLLEHAFSEKESNFLGVQFRLNKPIVGVGAPAHAWLPALAEKLGTELIIPEYAEVSSAVGASLGNIKESLNATVRPSKENGEKYLLYLPHEKKEFSTREDAEKYAQKILENIIRSHARKAGGDDIEITVNVEPVFIQPYNSPEKTYVETKIEVFGVSTPKILRS